MGVAERESEKISVVYKQKKERKTTNPFIVLKKKTKIKSTMRKKNEHQLRRLFRNERWVCRWKQKRLPRERDQRFTEQKQG